MPPGYLISSTFFILIFFVCANPRPLHQQLDSLTDILAEFNETFYLKKTQKREKLCKQFLG